MSEERGRFRVDAFLTPEEGKKIFAVLREIASARGEDSVHMRDMDGLVFSFADDTARLAEMHTKFAGEG